MSIGQGNVADLIELARPVADRLAASGYRSYVVGGLVRDLQLGGTTSHDVDITTDALPSQVKSAVGVIADKMWSQGERFGTIGLRVSGVDFEITTHRSEVYDSSSRKPVVRFSIDSLAFENRIPQELPQRGRVDQPHGLRTRLRRYLGWERVTPIEELTDPSFRGLMKRTLRRLRE